jgi:hypothetical protein
MAMTLTLTYPCGCSFTHNANSTANVTVSLCGRNGSNHRANEEALKIAYQLRDKMNEYQKITGN